MVTGNMKMEKKCTDAMIMMGGAELTNWVVEVIGLIWSV